MTRYIDRGAIVAGWVGVGMAATIATSFLLVIPIEPVYWYLALPSGLLIGYYANRRAGRAGAGIRRLLVNGLWAGVVTAVVYAALLLGVKALFFLADDGYRDASAGGRISCTPGADCVYQRYLAQGRDADLTSVGVTDAASFTAFYWNQQLSTAALLALLVVAGGAGGALIFGAANRRPRGSTIETGTIAAG
ncbi:MAG TPA: hypothetical protein VFS32_01330 [Candidatus Limnocylindrales bacterium]|nr:hypothetical protein [Candidatus Limnocylindrales bacterium]